MPRSADAYSARQRAISNSISARQRASTMRVVGSAPKRSRSSCGQVDAAAVEVLGDVAQEVGELEREPEVARRADAAGETARGSAASSRRSRPPSRPCSPSRSSQVSYGRHGEVHAIERRNRGSSRGRWSKARTVCTTAFSTGSSERPALQVARRTGRRSRRAPPPARRPCGRRGRRRCRRRSGRSRRAPTRGAASPGSTVRRPVVGGAVRRLSSGSA
jgi:hypothetical protein